MAGRRRKQSAILRVVLAGLSLLVLAAGGLAFLVWKNGWEDPRKTEVWQPVPPVVQPGQLEIRPPPSGAIVLFDGRGLAEWEAIDGSPARWTVSDGVLTVKKGTGNIRTRRRFGDYELHLEWRIPTGITGEGQSRGNSGLFLGSTGDGDAGYELQILDSYHNRTYVNGQAGAIYKQHPPLVNPMRPPGQWQTYDVTWSAPRFNRDGSLRSPAVVTVHMNGVLIQDGVELAGETRFIGKPAYHAHGRLPIMLQDHRDPSEAISFRNIWLRELDRAD